MTTTGTHRHSIFAGIALCAMIVTIAGCAGSAATTTAEAGRGSRGAGDATALYAGNWEGSFDISLGAGGLMLVLNHDDGSWTGEVTFDADGEIVSGAIESFVITEDGCSFQTLVQGEADVMFTGKLAEGSLAGMIEIYAQGQMMADGTFVLTKK
ncbi:hypothetical protein ACFL6R_06175 [Gemmatimonadota bacterium]